MENGEFEAQMHCLVETASKNLTKLKYLVQVILNSDILTNIDAFLLLCNFYKNYVNKILLFGNSKGSENE